MTILTRPADMPRRIDFVKWLERETGCRLTLGKFVLDNLVELGECHVPWTFSPQQVAELRELGVEVKT
jgi:hypothetical protein